MRITSYYTSTIVVLVVLIVLVASIYIGLV